jgi:hypothetical protein
MKRRGAGLSRIVERVDNLQEPFRKNAIDWLSKRTRRPLSNLRSDLEQFLQDQDPFVQDFFIKDTLSVLDQAVRHFGDSNIPLTDSRRERLEELMRGASVFHR